MFFEYNTCRTKVGSTAACGCSVLGGSEVNSRVFGAGYWCLPVVVWSLSCQEWC